MVRTFGENTWLAHEIAADSWLGIYVDARFPPGGTPESPRYNYDYSDGTTVGIGAFLNFNGVKSTVNDTHSDPVPTPEPEPDPACGPGWLRFGGSCYRLYAKTASWLVAKQICQDLDVTADLAWITSTEEDQFLRATGEVALGVAAEAPPTTGQRKANSS
ncbi:hypothetical protein BV898_06317 [Hypsibius exemplaris]|uniref:C-type lectin domain-containing protein n=1 Tax=Hypsibius exemplaris TaxID=2072580 RepID=A0A1W0WX58_HYPEX|nr:hypothetical protein BV898_06317 [Hypsibius exemplaris]